MLVSLRFRFAFDQLSFVIYFNRLWTLCRDFRFLAEMFNSAKLDHIFVVFSTIYWKCFLFLSIPCISAHNLCLRLHLSKRDVLYSSDLYMKTCRHFHILLKSHMIYMFGSNWCILSRYFRILCEIVYLFTIAYVLHVFWNMSDFVLKFQISTKIS